MTSLDWFIVWCNAKSWPFVVTGMIAITFYIGFFYGKYCALKAFKRTMDETMKSTIPNLVADIAKEN